MRESDSTSRMKNCETYKCSKVAYVAAYIEHLLTSTKDLLTNFSQFRFPDYKRGNIPLHLELL